MWRWCFFREASAVSRPLFLAALFLCLSLPGCGNSCFVFVSNPGGMISNTPPTCQFSNGNGTVALRITAPATLATGESPAGIQHIFVTLRGIEATPSAIADDNSPEWRELAPKLASQPMQVDLVARSADSCARSAFDDVEVPADAYRHVRLTLVSNQPDANESVLQDNACGSAGIHCVVTSDGGIRPLVLDRQLSQIQVGSDHIAGGFFRVLPDAAADLDIEFDPQSSLIFSANEPVRLVPVFTVQPQSPCESVATPNQ